jgi:hypothetical protein
VLGTLGTTFEAALGALDSLAASFITIARASNQTFPFVTIPQYGIHVSKTVLSTGALCTYFLPVIHFDQRDEWELYAAGNNTHLSSWVEESLDFQDIYSKFYGPMPQNRTWDAYDVIHGDFADVPYNVPRPNHLDVLLPGWHKFPLVMTDYYPANWGKFRIYLNAMPYLCLFLQILPFPHAVCCGIENTGTMLLSKTGTQFSIQRQ